MQPIGPLMHEHRLIERMLALMNHEAERIDKGENPDLLLLRSALDFIGTYADACHHGKEEQILFRELDKKALIPEQRRIMDELVQEHAHGRKLTATLDRAVSAFADRGGRPEAEAIRDAVAGLTAFYPGHIEKEDKHFFHPVMEYFDHREMDDMLAEYREADERLLHEYYKERVAALESGRP